MHWFAMMLMLSAQQEAERLDLEDALDEVDPATRVRIEEAIDRGDDLSELPILIEDAALEPRSRDGSISFFALFSYVRSSEERIASAFLIGLAIDFDEWIFAPEPHGWPPDEHHRFDRCIAIQGAPPGDRIAASAKAARLAALECGGRS